MESNFTPRSGAEGSTMKKELIMYKEQIKAYVPTDPLEAQEQQLMLDYFEYSPKDPLGREAGLAHLTSSGFILNETMDKALMVHHNIYHTWAWTGGHADGCPDLLETALKEAREETGVQEIEPLSSQIMSLDILPVWRHYKNEKPVGTHLHFNASFILMAPEEAPLQTKPDENSAVAWLELDRLSEYCQEPEVERIYAKLIEKAFYLTGS